MYIYFDQFVDNCAARRLDRINLSRLCFSNDALVNAPYYFMFF